MFMICLYRVPSSLLHDLFYYYSLSTRSLQLKTQFFPLRGISCSLSEGGTVVVLATSSQVSLEHNKYK